MDKSLRLIIFVAAVAIVGLYSCKKQEKTGNTGNNTHIGITDIKLDKNTLELKEGDTVTATAHILHKGRTLHQWLVEIRNTAGELVCSVQVTNYVIKGRKDD